MELSGSEYLHSHLERNSSGTLSVSPPFPIFCKVGERIKKIIFKGFSLSELREIIFQKFSLKFETRDNVPLYICLLKDTSVSSLLKDNTELYPNCILELKLPQKKIPKKISQTYEFQRSKVVFVMVGLPARGKSYTANKIARYLKWIGLSTKVFNVGQYRRARVGPQTWEFFDPNNPLGKRQRKHMAIAALDDMVHWLQEGGNVGIYDATNSTRERRKMISDRCELESLQSIFVESICYDEEILNRNINDKTKGPDYQFVDKTDALKDFQERIREYEKVYETIDEKELDKSYIKIIDAGRKVIINKIDSYLNSRIVHFLMNLHLSSRPIWLTLCGEDEFSVQGRLGGNSDLTSNGEEYAHILADWVDQNVKSQNFSIWTSSMKRSISTAQYINRSKIVLRALDEIDTGVCEGLTMDQIEKAYPQEILSMNTYKLNYQYPQGESYIDVINRLEPVLYELERQKDPVLVVSHRAVLQSLFAYFNDIEIEEIPWIKIKPNTIYEFIPMAYQTQVKEFSLL